MRKLCLFGLSMILILLFSMSTAFAEVTTFGFNDNRTRTTEGTAGVFWPAWKDDSGVSYSQPLILKGWGAYSGKTVVVAVTGNQVRGYVCAESVISPDGDFAYQQNDALWSISLTGSKATKSHPAFVEKPTGKYVYIGTDTPGYLHIIDITDFSRGKEAKCIDDYFSVDIVSAPLILNWRGHEVVVYTVGNNPSVHLAIDPLELEEPNIIEIKVAASGRTSSTPAPVLGGQGFVVGLDRGGGKAQGEMRVYKLDDILGEADGVVYHTSCDSFFWDTTLASVVASFSVDGNSIYFGDQASRVYGYDLDSGSRWYNDDHVGVFSNRSPALTANTVYFPATGAAGEKGKILAIDRSTHRTNWAAPFASRAQTAPIVWIDTTKAAAMVLAGTSGGDLALLNPYKSGENYSNIPIALPSGGSAYASGVSGELSAGENWLVGTTTSGVIAWQAIPLDLAVVSIDPGCPWDGLAFRAEPGARYTATAVIKGAPMPGSAYLDIPLAAFNEIGGVAYPAALTDVAGTELNRKVKYNNSYYTSMSRLDNEQKVQFQWTATPGGQFLTMAINLDYPAGAGRLMNIFPESTFENNLLRVPITVGGYDIKIDVTVEKSEYEAVSGTIAVYSYATVTRKDDIPGELQAEVTISGGAAPAVYSIALAPGGSQTIDYSFPGTPGNYTITGAAWPIGSDDIFPSDNTDRASARVNAGTAIPGGERGIRVGL